MRLNKGVGAFRSTRVLGPNSFHFRYVALINKAFCVLGHMNSSCCRLFIGPWQADRRSNLRLCVILRAYILLEIASGWTPILYSIKKLFIQPRRQTFSFVFQTTSNKKALNSHHSHFHSRLTHSRKKIHSLSL